MTEPTTRRMVGGPKDGMELETSSAMVTIEGHDGWAYRRVRQPDGEVVMEWHVKGWISPAEQSVRDAYAEGVRRLRGEP